MIALERIPLDMAGPTPWWVVPALDRVHGRLLDTGDIHGLSALLDLSDEELIELARREVLSGSS